MKTGRVAKLFARDPKTIIKWTDTFEEFFSPEAKGSDGNQRLYSLDDLFALNTIRILMGNRETEAVVHNKLKSGYRETSLPPEFSVLEGDKAIAVYAEMSQMKAEITSLREQLTNSATTIDKKDAEISGLNREIAQLNREIGKWQAMYEMLKEQNEEDE
jgi:DNA-binding transcriptional MerR regulator